MTVQAPAQMSAVVLFARLYDGEAVSPHMQVVFIHALHYVLEKFGGTLLQDDSDHLVAAFNLPIQVPFPAFLAMKCAAEMHQVFNGLRREMTGTPIKLAVGISRGMINLHTYHGMPIDLARYIAHQSGSGDITVTDIVYDEVKSVADRFKLIGRDEIVLGETPETLALYRFTLPDENQPAARPLSSIVSADEGDFQVLIAEDAPSLRSLFAKVLKNAGFNVHIAVNGHDVMAQLEQFLPDVLVLDLGMPGVSGEEVIRYVRQQTTTRPIKIVVVTGNHLAAQSELASQVDLLLIKPVSPRDLVNFVKRFMN